jgi:hypothetical protein
MEKEQEEKGKEISFARETKETGERNGINSHL